MIIAMGIDIIEIEEIKELIEKNERFLDLVFTPQEILYCEGKPNKYASYAVRFAAKEAVMKALGTGWDKGIQWKQIEVINGNRTLENGTDSMPNTQCTVSNEKQEIKLTGKALKLSKEMGVGIIFLSLSHSKNNAMASVVFDGYYDKKNYF